MSLPTLRLDGKVVSESVREKLKVKVDEFLKMKGRPPQLTVVLVGKDEASQVYVRNKEKACHKLGLQSKTLHISESATEDELIQNIHQLNSDDNVDGILVQLPLPKGIRLESVLKAISPEKDADGLSLLNQGLIWSGFGGVAPCTPAGILEILKFYKIQLAGQHVVVIGRSEIVGKPMAHLLQQQNATVTLCHSKTSNMQAITSSADIVVVAAGKKSFFGKSYFKKGAVIVDVGIHGTGTQALCGDVIQSEVEGWASALTPVPGGVGPMTITMLLVNTVNLAIRRFQLRGNK